MSLNLTFTTHIVLTTADDFIFQLKAQLKLAGWVVTKSGDATTYNGSGDQITTATSGAGGLGNTNAWFVIRMPSVSGVQREFSFQRGASAGLYTVNYSYSNGFTGAGTASAIPSLPADGKNVCTARSIFAASGSFQRVVMHIGVQYASPYGFVAWPVTAINSLAFGVSGPAFILDPLVVGSYSPSELDPYVIYLDSDLGGFGGGGTLEALTNSSVPFGCGWIGKGTASESFSLIRGVGVGGDTPISAGVSPYTGSLNLWPLLWTSDTRGAVFGAGIKGMSSFLKFPSIQMQFGETLSESSSRDWYVQRSVAYPWDGSLPFI